MTVRRDLAFILISLFFLSCIPYLYSIYIVPSEKWTENFPSPRIEAPSLAWAQLRFKRSFTIQIKVEDYDDIENVQIGFSEWVDGKPEPVTTWNDCRETNNYYTFPEPLQLLFEYNQGDHWLILGDNVGVRFQSNSETIEVGEVDLDFRITRKTYLSIYKNKIKNLQIIIDEKETKIAFVWEGPLFEVPSECLVFRGLKGRLVKARFPLPNTVTGFRLVKGEEEIEKLEFNVVRDYIDALALEIFDPVTGNKTSTYFLTSENYSLYRIPYSENSSICGMTIRELEDAEMVFAGGVAFDYISPVDRKQYSLLKPISIWKDELPAPKEQARRFLINKVGEEYFNTYFSQARVEKNTFEPEDWATLVSFPYHITVGNYSRTEGVGVYFNQEDFIISTRGIPTSDNLMPFNVTRKEAIETAIRKGSPPRILEIEAEILYWKKLSVGTRINKYVWMVNIYLTPPNAMKGYILQVIINVHTGKIYDIVRSGWVAES